MTKKIKETIFISRIALRNICEKNGYFEKGDSKQWLKLTDMIPFTNEITIDKLYHIAEYIFKNHTGNYTIDDNYTENENVEIIMFKLNEALERVYSIIVK